MAGLRYIGLERIALQGRIWLEGYLKLKNRDTDETALIPETDFIHVYARGDKLYYRNHAGVEKEIATV